MNYSLMPSLEHIALVKIVVALWNQDDIKTGIENYCLLHLRKEKEFVDNIDYTESKKWMEIEERVSQKVTQLKLPECFKKKLFGIVKPIGLDLLNWIKHYEYYTYYKPCKLPYNPCWTSLGKVDEKRSVEMLVKDKSIHITDRFVLACNYCLEDDVRELWKSVPETVKMEFYSKDIGGDSYKLMLAVFWTYYLKGELAELTRKISDSRIMSDMSRETSPYEYGFIIATCHNNKEATEYFLKKLDPLVEREKCLMEYECFEDSGDFVCFLLSQMNEEEQIMYFTRNDAYNILRCFLEWPVQSFFKETFVIFCKSDILLPMDFYLLLEIIMKKISNGIAYRDYNYQELLEQIWLLSPESCKEYVFRDWAESEYARLLHDMAYEGNVMIILKDATIQKREEIILNQKRCFINLIDEGKWDMVKLLIEECISSTEKMIEFRNKFFPEEFYRDYYDPELDELEELGFAQREPFSQLMDEVIKKKRSIEESECNQAKKPRI